VSAPRVNAQDVAARAGCSTAAVSLVMNGRDSGRVSAKLRGEILRAVAELGYRAHPGARALATGVSRRLALVCPDLRNAFFAELFHGVLAGVGDRLEVDVVVGRDDHDYDETTVRLAQHGDVAGLILAGPSRAVVDAVDTVLPVVLVDAAEPAERQRFPSIDLDLESAGALLAEHLCDLGHRAIGYLDSAQDKATYRRRRDGLAKAARRRGAEVVVGRDTAEQDFAAAGAAFAANLEQWRDAGVTALVCAEERLTFGALQAAKARGLVVPDELSLAGFDDTAYATLVDPALTSIRFDAFELGRRAGVALADRIDGAELGLHPPVGVTLQARESTAPPGRGLGAVSLLPG